MPRLYGENIMSNNNRTSISQQQWSTANNQGNQGKKKILIQVFKISLIRYLIISKKK